MTITLASARRMPSMTMWANLSLLGGPKSLSSSPMDSFRWVNVF